MRITATEASTCFFLYYSRGKQSQRCVEVIEPALNVFLYFKSRGDSCLGFYGFKVHEVRVLEALEEN